MDPSQEHGKPGGSQKEAIFENAGNVAETANAIWDRRGMGLCRDKIAGAFKLLD